MSTYRVPISILDTFADERVETLSKLDLLRHLERKGFFAIETEDALELLCANGILIEECRDGGSHFRIAAEEHRRLEPPNHP